MTEQPKPDGWVAWLPGGVLKMKWGNSIDTWEEIRVSSSPQYCQECPNPISEYPQYKCRPVKLTFLDEVEK